MSDEEHSSARACFALDLGAVQDPPRGRVKGITPVHGTPVVPEDEVAYTPFVVPREFLTSCIGPQLVEQRFGVSEGKAVNVGVAPSPKV